MPIKTIKYIIFLLISSIIYAQSDKNILSLQDAVDLAIEKNINIKQSELNLKNTELNRSDAIGNFLPSIGVSANHQWNIGRGVNVTTNIIQKLKKHEFGNQLGLQTYI